MATFSYREKIYSAKLFLASDKQKILIITNSSKDELYIGNNTRIAIRKNVHGNTQEINLDESPQRKEFYDGLIREARKVAEQDQQEKELDEEGIFYQQFETEYEPQAQDFNKTLNIAVIGNVSSGKSSLINALLRRNRHNTVADVGAISGVTTRLNILRLDERVRLIDSPGLGDIRGENSKVTQDLLKNIDVGILVVTGSADASQRLYFDDLRANCNSVFLVLNKCDQWDRYNPEALEDVQKQWKDCLGIDRIYPVRTFGYDKQLPDNVPLDLKGVDELREDIEFFLESDGKKLLIARHMGEKKTYAKGIIVAALALVGIQAALPGKAAFITATQVGAIVSLYYLYTGKILSKGSALALLPVFIGQSVASNVFLWVVSIIPPTGIVEVGAAITAVSITAAMLSAVNFVLSSGIELTEKDTSGILKSKFNEYKKLAGSILKQIVLTDVTKLGSLNFKDIIDKLF